MKIIIIILLFAASTVSYAFDFKGIEVGKSSSNDEVSKILMIQCTDDISGKVICTGPLTIVGDDAYGYIDLNKDKIVSSIWIKFKPNTFNEISEALIKKYGPPITTNSTISNAMGATFDQVEMNWKNENSIMTLQKYSGKVTEGGLFIISNEHLNEIDQRLKIKKSDI